MKFSKKIIPLLIGALPLLIIYILLSCFIIINYQKKITEFRNKGISGINSEKELVTITYKNFADFLYRRCIADTDVPELMYDSWKTPENRDKNRELLGKKMNSLYNDIKNHSFRQLHFHLPDTESFLRMHRPEKYGDKLAGVRQTVEDANLYRKSVSGFEEGRIFNGYRYVYPLFYKGEHAGSVEISISFNAVIESLNKLFEKEYSFIMNKQIVDKKVFNSEKSNYTECLLSSDYLIDNGSKINKLNMIFSTLNSEDRSFLNDFKDKFRSQSDFIHSFSFSGTDYIFYCAGLYNYRKEHAGYLIAVEKSEVYKQIKNTAAMEIIVLSIIIILIFILVEYYIWVKMKMEELAMYDKLTNLYNRHMFIEIFRQTINRMKRFKVKSVIIMADIDNFKKINDKYGHNKGDSVLQIFASILKKNLRESDVPARWGGEEFLIMLPRTELEYGVRVADKIREIIESKDFGIRKKITCSFGVAELHPEDDNIPAIIEKADQMLYKAKKNGRNRVEW